MPPLLRSRIQRLTRLIAPPVCALCGGDGQSLDEPWGFDLCPHCEAACEVLPPDLRRVIGAQAPPGCSAAVSLFRYGDPVDGMITRLKFGHELVHARVLGMLFARHLRADRHPLPDCVIPLPLHLGRLRERGFCQTTQIARHLVHRLRDARNRPLPLRGDLLARCRATLPQSGLSAAARAGNLQGAFKVMKPFDLPRHVALLDDVLTTGHTAAAAAQVLREAGCQQIELWTCARALRADSG
jgi:ComF family protein